MTEDQDAFNKPTLSDWYNPIYGYIKIIKWNNKANKIDC